ncbi:MerR family transcriptional regulator [Actinomadura sp. GTD37]|uniref:MerR family transcriptional regulator n=1 Tax=Actinomadura sp. GTD37 TaxID=1778030 RepID=UPI0035BF7935
MDVTWTIGELAERAAAALAADGAAQVSGRVRDLPNARLIRWYTTIGLVDPPLGRRGRTALYGPRHLLQLVAVKRRQAEGRSIAEIQLELAAAPGETLARIAALPGGPPHHAISPAAPPVPLAGPSEPRADRPAGAVGTPAASAQQPPDSTARVAGAARASIGRPGDTTRNVSDPAGGSADGAGAPAGDISQEERAASAGGGAPGGPADTSGRERSGAPAGGSAGSAEAGTADPGAPAAALMGTSASPEGGGVGDRGAFWATRPDVSYDRADVSADYGRPLPPVVQGVRLAPGLTLLLDGPALSGDDLAAIDSAARPLLDELHRRGLLVPAAGPAFPPEAHSRRSQ